MFKIFLFFLCYPKKSIIFVKKLIIMETNLIEELGLTDQQVHKIVLEWYTNGMCPDVWQNEDGSDLEEYLEPLVYY